MIGKLLDYRYKVIRVLATGGFGETYIAEDTKRPGNPVCVVKHLKPASGDLKLFDTAKRLFQSEAETLEKLGSHDQIPRLLAYFVEHQEFYLVQEFIEGHTLSEELVRSEKWDEKQVTSLLYEVLSILEFVHQQGVIHRDIKPDNIIRRRSDRQLVLVDFGAVKQLRGGAGYPARGTVIGGQASATVAIGTPGYMPTEQGQGKPRANSDLYALGIIAAQALTGIAPMDLQEDIHTGEILWQHSTSVSPEFATILNKMIRYHFKERYQNATQALQAIRGLVGIEESSSYQAVSSYRTSYPLARYTSVNSHQKTVAVAPGNQIGKSSSSVNTDVKPLRKGATGPDLLQIFILLLLAGGAAAVAPAVVKNVQGLAANWTKGNTVVAQNCLAMTDESANIRSEPSSINTNTILETVSDRTALAVTGTRTKRGWLQVRLDSGKTAWVHSDVIGNNEEWATCLRDKGIAMKTLDDNNLIADRPAPKPKPVINLNPFAQNPESEETPTQNPEKQVDPVKNNEVVQEAREKFEAGDLQGAIALLKSVPAGIEETSKMVSQWQEDWSKAEALFKDIDAAVASGNWEQVNSYKDHPEKLPNIQYWRDKIDPLVQQAADNVSQQAENLIKQQQSPKVNQPQKKNNQN